jgi:hypothetical protein
MSHRRSHKNRQEQLNSSHLPRLIIEHRRTRDNRVDDADGCGWRMIPVPPSPDGRGEWHIVDDSHDYKTRWQRYRVERGDT